LNTYLREFVFWFVGMIWAVGTIVMFAGGMVTHTYWLAALALFVWIPGGLAVLSGGDLDGLR
jgi:hypothetical protein